MESRGTADTRSVAVYAEGLVTGALPRESAVQALQEVLPRIHAESDVDLRTLFYLCLALVSSDPCTESPFMLDVLRVLESAGEPAAEPYVRALAESWTLWKVARPVRRRARKCLSALHAERSRRTEAATLLRGSELPQEMMVRPAESMFGDPHLLRARQSLPDLL